MQALLAEVGSILGRLWALRIAVTLGPQVSSLPPGTCPGERLTGPRFSEISSFQFAHYAFSPKLRAKQLVRFLPSPAAPNVAKVDPNDFAMIFIAGVACCPNPTLS